MILASFQCTSAVNLDPEEWVLLATQYHHWGLPTCVLSGPWLEIIQLDGIHVLTFYVFVLVFGS